MFVSLCSALILPVLGTNASPVRDNIQVGNLPTDGVPDSHLPPTNSVQSSAFWIRLRLRVLATPYTGILV